MNKNIVNFQEMFPLLEDNVLRPACPFCLGTKCSWLYMCVLGWICTEDILWVLRQIFQPGKSQHYQIFQTTFFTWIRSRDYYRDSRWCFGGKFSLKMVDQQIWRWWYVTPARCSSNLNKSTWRYQRMNWSVLLPLRHLGLHQILSNVRLIGRRSSYSNGVVALRVVSISSGCYRPTTLLKPLFTHQWLVTPSLTISHPIAK